MGKLTQSTTSYDVNWDQAEKERDDIDRYSMTMEELQEGVTPELEEKYSNYFDRFAKYVGNGIYTIGRMYSTDTRELFLMYIHMREDLEMYSFSDKMQTKKRDKDWGIDEQELPF